MVNNLTQEDIEAIVDRIVGEVCDEFGIDKLDGKEVCTEVERRLEEELGQYPVEEKEYALDHLYSYYI
ncbi:MAG: hypothetical protein PUP91_16350 [Rhizonema sp. PD37]|nr:hypothetical protein [Rhizonema sp. PD37]